jgi:sulfur-carrier protein adenylyltransferase/sulfurtransferase
LNPYIEIVLHNTQLTSQNALDIIKHYDVVADGTDNFPTRYLVNDACVLLDKPLIYGAVSRFEGQVAVFNIPAPGHQRSANYRDLFPTPPADGEAANCAESGVIGVLTGVIGSLQAAEAIKVIAHVGRPLSNQLQTFNMLRNEWYSYDLQPLEKTSADMPQTAEEFAVHPYFSVCEPAVTSISAAQLNSILAEQELTILDVREWGEMPVPQTLSYRQVPLSGLRNALPEIAGHSVVTFCQTGKRSKIAADLLKKAFPDKAIYNLEGGIEAWITLTN